MNLNIAAERQVPISSRQEAALPPIPALTSLRFFAALAIVIFHLSGWGGAFKLSLIETLSQGVSFFFVLSGFILTYSYSNRKFNWPTFFKSRFARVWPLHIFMMGFVFLFEAGPTLALDDTKFWTATFLNFFLMQSWIPDSKLVTSFNSVSWSISVEAFFYLCFPFLFRGKWWPLCMLVAFAVFSAALIIANRSFEGLESASFNEIWAYFLYNGSIARLPEFIIGILTAKIFLASRHLSISKFKATLLECLCIAAIFYSLSDIWSVLIWMDGLGGATQYLTRFNLGAPVFALLIFVFAFSRGWLSIALSNRFWVILGEASFALYMTHSFVIKAVVSADLVGRYNEWVAMTIAIVVSILVSCAVWMLVEIPCRSFIMKFRLKPPFTQSLQHS
jgi:peptidoglycan/LPS O-acetylase OafA/YrhL